MVTSAPSSAVRDEQYGSVDGHRDHHAAGACRRILCGARRRGAWRRRCRPLAYLDRAYHASPADGGGAHGSGFWRRREDGFSDVIGSWKSSHGSPRRPKRHRSWLHFSPSARSAARCCPGGDRRMTEQAGELSRIPDRRDAHCLSVADLDVNSSTALRCVLVKKWVLRPDSELPTCFRAVTSRPVPRVERVAQTLTQEAGRSTIRISPTPGLGPLEALKSLPARWEMVPRLALSRRCRTPGS